MESVTILSPKDQSSFIIDPDETILVTGANGFIGSKVVCMLIAYGFKNIRCLTRPTSQSERLDKIIQKYSGTNLDVIQGNLLSKDTCRDSVKGVSLIYHLAAGVEKSFPGCFLNSVVTTRNLLDAAVEEKSIRRFVNISSIAVYSNDRIPRGGLLDENCKLDSKMIERFEPYSYGKLKQDELVLEYAGKHDFSYAIVRPSVVYGPGKAKITDRIASNTFGIYLHLGLNNIIPLTYVDNCAEAIVLAGLRKEADRQVFNICDDDLPTSRRFLRLYKRHVRRILSVPVPYRLWYFFNYLWEKYSKWSYGQLPPVFNPRACAFYWKGNSYSNRKAKELLGWTPRISMQDGLRKFFNYMKESERGNK